MLNYDFEIQHVSTNEFGCAELLSRQIDRTNQPEEEYVLATLRFEENHPFRSSREGTAMLRKATSTNAILQTVAKHIRDGWSSCSKNLLAAVQPYFQRRESLSVVDGCRRQWNPGPFFQTLVEDPYRLLRTSSLLSGGSASW